MLTSHLVTLAIGATVAIALPPPTLQWKGNQFVRDATGQILLAKPSNGTAAAASASSTSSAAAPARGTNMAAAKPGNGTRPSSDVVVPLAGDVGSRVAALSPAWDYGGSRKVRGVNLGGWLVAEPWITPSLFDNTGDSRVIDEWTFGQYVGDAESRLQRHWATWITEQDIIDIANAGLNHVRIPIGYWAFDTSAGEPYVKSNQFDYLKKAVGWCSKHNIKVMVDLHGAPGSQNGFDNSGRKGGIAWPNDQKNANRAKAVLTTLGKTFAQSQYSNTVTIIQALNEPFMVGGANIESFTKQYFRDAYGTLRYDTVQGSMSNIVVGLHDGFEGLSYWKGFMPPPQYQQVVMDTHIYTVFDNNQVAQSNSARLQSICSHRQDIRNNQGNFWTIVGEWTSAPTDCAKYLNGRGIGARYDGSFPGSNYVGDCSQRTGNGNNFSSSYKNFLKQMFETQVSVYETGSGWIEWTWKAEQAADWSYQAGLKGGWITYDLNNLKNVQC